MLCLSGFELYSRWVPLNRQFVQFARIPVEFVARLGDLSTQKYNNYSIAAVILGYLLLIYP